MSDSDKENYTVDIKEKKNDWYEVVIIKPFWVGSAIWQPERVVYTFIPPMKEEGIILYYDQELGSTVRIPLTHCQIKKFEYVVRTTIETFWNHWEDDGILPEDSFVDDDWFDNEKIDLEEIGNWK